ncbi:hypothetical protein Tco_0721652, partial [Tanacetum coccineum]
MKMVPYEAFACRCGAGDVVLRESYKPKTREERVRLLVGSPGASTTPCYSPGPSTPPSYSPGPSRNAECSNCKLLLGKIKLFSGTFKKCRVCKLHALDWKATTPQITAGQSGCDTQPDVPTLTCAPEAHVRKTHIVMPKQQ